MRHLRIPALAATLLSFALAAQAQERDRAKIPDKYKWNVADLYPTEEAWRAAKDKLTAEIPKVAAFKGTLASSPARLADALDAANTIGKDLQRVYLYASLLADQDTRVSKYQGMQQELQQIAAGFGQQVSFIEPEILKIEKATLDGWTAKEPRLKTYQHYLNDIQRRRPHTLSDSEEKLLAASALVANASSSTFNIFSNADFPYPTVTLSDGKSVKLDSSASMLVYPIFANWVWGAGWLSQLGAQFGLGHGHVDFAGSSVVHMVGGVAALAGAIVIGPRLGKYSQSGESMPMPGHDLPMALAGTFILAFGWFGFNPGSTLAGGDLRIAVVATNTMLAGTGGAVAAMFYVWKRLGKPDPSMLCNGMLAGLVAITAPCAFVNSVSAVIIGAVAGILVVESVLFIDRVLKIDDPVGAISVHGVCGAFGVLSVGIFADGAYGDGWNGVPGTVRGLLYGDPSQLAAQAVGTFTCIVWVFTLFFAFFKIVEALMGNRVTAEVELDGLDIPEMGALAYPDFVLGPGTPLGGTPVATATPGVTAAQPTLKPIRG